MEQEFYEIKHNDNSININKDFFYRDISSLNNEHLSKHPHDGAILTMPQDTLIPIEYKKNSMTYRSGEFNLAKDILALGCSQTHGHGMIEEFTWPNLLSTKLNMSFDRLAIGGDSIQGQVTKAFEYFRSIGHPKLIVATFPLYRMEIPFIKDFFKYTSNNSKPVQQLQLWKKVSDDNKYLKKPFDAEQIIPMEMSIFLSFTFINMLIQYCNSNNIKIIWNIWEDKNQEIYNYIQNQKKISRILNEYYVGDDLEDNVFSSNSDFHKKKECHSEYLDHPLFNKASDWTLHNPGHWSLHKHIHIAESFFKEINNRNLI